MSTQKATAPETNSKWTFLTNHLHVVLCLHRNEETTVRDLALKIGITERTVQRILGELVESKVLTRKKIGRCNKYSIRQSYRLRHQLEKNHTIEHIFPRPINRVPESTS